MLRVTVTHYLKDHLGNTIYTTNDDGRKAPKKGETEVTLPLRFGYGSYNDGRMLLDYGIKVDDIISIGIDNSSAFM